jgi:fucose 4-O-acetylase-like acetyltransferase
MTERVLTPPMDALTAPVRSNAVDIVKGLAILLVTYEHTAQGMRARGWWTGASREFSDHYVYSFHMPAFFFLAGLFVAGSIRRRGARDFVAEKMKTILYLYLVWAILLSAVEPLVSRFKSNPVTIHWEKFPISLINGAAGWFFPVLFCCLVLALLTYRVPAWLRLAAAFGVAAFMPAYGFEVFYKTTWYFAFLAGGMVVGRSIFKLDAMPRWVSGVGALAVFALQAAVMYHYKNGDAFGSPPQWLSVVLGFTGTAGLCLLARTIDHTMAGDAWAWIGRASLGIFLMAQFPQGATRELLLRLAPAHEFWAQLILPTIVSTLVPAIIWHQQKRWHIGWLFRWPLS